MFIPVNKYTAAMIAVLLTACTTPGQHFPLPAQEQETGVPWRLIPLTADVIAPAEPMAVKDDGALRAALENYEYRVGPRDVLTFTVWDHPELTIPAGAFRSPEIQGHLVSAAGEIFFPYIGTVKVAGRTLTEVRTDLTDRLSRYIKNPQLDVRIADFRSQRFSVSGQVSAPGYYPVTDLPITLVDAVSAAGGANSEAALQDVSVVRDGQRLTYNLLALLRDGDLSQNTVIRDGDLIYVPRNDRLIVHVLGSVEQPGPVVMVDGRLNLATALSERGGIDRRAAHAGRIFVFRPSESGADIFWLDARSPQSMILATRFALLPQDVVFVDATGLARFNRVVSLLLPTVQTLWQTQSVIDRSND